MINSHYRYSRWIASAFLACALNVSGVSAQDNTPDIFRPDPVNGALLYGLSDNGDWGVSNVSPGYDGFSDFAGASIYDLRSIPVKSVDLGMGETFVSAYDVSDDGKTVGGSFRQKPAVCRYEDGKWSWHLLPIPDREVSVRNVYTDEIMTYRLNGGEVTGLTPDGKYGVGLIRSVEYINLEVGCMWNLETMEIMELPGLGLENSTASRINQISADGRYLVVRKGGYQLYDRETATTTRIPLGLDIYAQGMSTDGSYISGVTEVNDVPYASFWDVKANKTTVLNDRMYADAVAWTITNDGVPLVARPYLTPYAEAYVYYGGFLYSFREILTESYGIKPEKYGIDNTGKPFKVSADGRTIVFITEVGNCYVMRLKEDIGDAVARVDLFKNWSVTPSSGTRMAYVKQVKVSFTHEIELVPGFSGTVELLDSKGNVVKTPVANGGTSVSGTDISLRFTNYAMQEGETYTLRIPAGMIRFKGLPDKVNPEFTVNYTGRGTAPVKPVSYSPALGSSMTSISLNDNPVSVVFDDMIKVSSSGERPIAKVYIDGENDLVGYANLDVDLNTGKTLVIFPDNTIPFYKGSTYNIVVPAGAVTDMSDSGGCESFVLNYQGSLVPQLGEGKYIFRSTCDDYTNFLFYEGDHGIPTAEYAAMNFTQDETPWSVVREDENSTDMAFGSHSGYDPLVRADDWVATRQLLIPADANAYLAFDSQSYRKSKVDYLKVYVYENAAILNSLNENIVDDIRKNGDLVYNEIQSPGATEANLAGEWRHNVIDLADYAGKSIYICFLNDNYDGSMVMIDNIEVVNDLNAFITLRTNTSVVRQSEAVIRGMVTVSSEAVNYSGVSMTLRDADGKVVSTTGASGLDLKADDFYAFEFPQPLPLAIGEENKFTVECELDSDKITFEGMIYDLAFEPEQHVVIEEYTGRDCQYCPGGIVTLEHLESLYGNKVIPVALHCYMGTDPKGRNVMAYWEFTGMGAAPQARVNRGPISSPILNTPSGFVNMGVEGEKLWKDYVLEEFSRPPLVEVSVVKNSESRTQLDYTATFRSALNLEDVNYRVFGVLLEDGLLDSQSNAYVSETDPLLGEWGYGGLYGSSLPLYIFNNVARATWGTGFNGTGGLIPSMMKVDEPYEVKISMNVPEVVEKVENCKFVVMLIDENTGRVVNASRSDIEVSGVEAPMADGASPEIWLDGGSLLVSSASRCSVDVFDMSGRVVARGSGEGIFSVSLDGYRGLAVVKASSDTGTKTMKILSK